MSTLHSGSANLTVFLGADTALYTEANAGGRTVVVEHRAAWRKKVADLPCEIVAVDYDMKVKDGLLEAVGYSKGFPPDLLDVLWSVILVDSPEGHTDQMPGRQQSIFAASQAAKHGTTTFLHDYNQTHEKSAADKYLGAKASR